VCVYDVGRGVLYTVGETLGGGGGAGRVIQKRLQIRTKSRQCNFEKFLI